MKRITEKEYEALAGLILDTRFNESICAVVELETTNYLFVVNFIAEVFYEIDELPEGKFRRIQDLVAVDGSAQTVRLSDRSYEHVDTDFSVEKLSNYLIGAYH